MSYISNEDLPDNVRDVLPEHAQSIYREAFNSAWEQYENPQDRLPGNSREETSHAVAWSAVKKVFIKNEDGEWVKKE